MAEGFVMTDEMKAQREAERREWNLVWSIRPVLKLIACAGKDAPDECITEVTKSIIAKVRDHDEATRRSYHGHAVADEGKH